MKKNLKIVIAALLIAAVAMCTCCSYSAESWNSARRTVSVKVEVKPKTEKMESRAVDENSLKDVNIFLFGTKSNYHFFYPDPAPAYIFEVQPEAYAIYVVTNVHHDLGAMTKKSLMDYQYFVETMTEDIPMTASLNVNILSSMSLPPLEVTRAAAKISYSIRVDDAVAGTIKLRSVQFCNVPISSQLFGTGESSLDKNDYYHDEAISIDDERSFAGVHYLLENCQGEVPSIIDQMDKTSVNAPA